MSNYDADETGSTISDLLEDETEQDTGNGELLPEIQAAIAKGLREFESQYDLSKQPGLMLDLYTFLETALKECGSPGLTDPSFVPGRAVKAKRKTKVSGYIVYTKEAWAKYKEEKKALKKADPNYKDDSTPQDMLSKFALAWKGLSPLQRKPYMDKAAQLNNPTTPAGIAAAAAAKKRATRKKGPLSGYQYFVTQTKCPEGMASTGQMKYKAQLWSALSDEQKLEYKFKSEESFWNEHPDLLEAKKQKEAEDALKEEQRRLNIQNMRFNAPVLKLPSLLKKPLVETSSTAVTVASGTSAEATLDTSKTAPTTSTSTTSSTVTATTASVTVKPPVRPVILSVPVIKKDIIKEPSVTSPVVSVDTEAPIAAAAALTETKEVTQVKKPEIKLGALQRPITVKEPTNKPVVVVKPMITLKN